MLFPAKIENIDDLGFIRALITKFRADFGVSTSRIFVMGYSLGGDMAYRLALEIPDEIIAVAIVATNLQTDDNLDCRVVGKPIPVLIMNGTSDSIIPYNGGFGVGGEMIRSAQASAEYFAKLNGHTASPKTTRLPHQIASDPVFVDRTVWSETSQRSCWSRSMGVGMSYHIQS